MRSDAGGLVDHQEMIVVVNHPFASPVGPQFVDHRLVNRRSLMFVPGGGSNS
jgi:hypothetical protein